MTIVSEALGSIDDLKTQEWVLSGEPTNGKEFLEMFSLICGVSENGEILYKKDTWVTWGEVKKNIEKIKKEAPLSDLVKERNRRLAETDWWSCSDVHMSLEQSEYRKKLRDITQKYSSLDDVVWPIMPNIKKLP